MSSLSWTFQGYDSINKEYTHSTNKKAVYTATPDAGGWAGAVMSWAGAFMSWAEAAMIWAGAVMIWAGTCSNTNIPTLKLPKNAKKLSVTDGRTQSVTDRHGDL